MKKILKIKLFKSHCSESVLKICYKMLKLLKEALKDEQNTEIYFGNFCSNNFFLYCHIYCK